MKLYVISDTHGRIEKPLEVYDRLDGIDLIVHLGDVDQDIKPISEHTGKPVLTVRGNNEYSFCKTPEHEILETPYGKILLTHGHRDQVKLSLQGLLYRAAELECIAVFYGHTHLPHYEIIDGIHVLNPGSLAIPFDGTLGSFAIVEISENEFSVSIQRY